MSTMLARNLRSMSWSSGFSSPSADIVIGSRAIPQIGQAPGPSATICGCIGQVHFVAPAGGIACGAADASRNLPGSARNRSRQRMLQKPISLPSWTTVPPPA